MNMPVAGAQLYTVREFCKTIKDVATTLEKVKAIGYTAVQVSGFGPVDPKDVDKLLDQTGVVCAGTHVSWNRYLDELDAVIEEHQMWKCSHAGIGGLPGEYRDADGIKRFLDEFGPVGAKLKAAGMDFSYHNHNHELVKLNGKTWLAALYEQADPAVLKAEIDTYWIQAGGGDPEAWVRKVAGRIPLLHVKDMCITPEREVRFAEIGEGNLNWPAIMDAAKDAGVEYCLVEQDLCYGRDPFESLAISYRNLKAMGVS